jgi:hypothetical protein
MCGDFAGYVSEVVEVAVSDEVIGVTEVMTTRTG